MDTVVNNPIQTGEWLPLSLAAQKAGVSVQTLRRRIKDHSLQARQVDSPFGKAWEVLLDSPVDGGVNSPDQNKTGVVNDPIQDQEPGTGNSSSELIEALRLIQHLQEGMVAKAEAAAMWQARAEMLSFQLQGAQETIRMLEAPKPQASEAVMVPESPQEEPETAENREVVAEASSEPQQPWWRRFWQLVSV
jgi:hypothetical protein